MFKTLLRGQATGAPLFLAWSFGVFWAVAAATLTAQITDDFYRVWFGIVCSLTILSVWQSILLLSTWQRRVAWSLGFVAVAVPIFWKTISASWTWNYYCGVQIFHGLLLIGVRKRVWLWVFIAVFGNPFFTKIDEPLEPLYVKFMLQIIGFMPRTWFMPLGILYPFVLQAVYGVIAAFLMPPIKKSLPT